MDEIRRLLPPGYEIHSSYDATKYIHAELNKIYLRSGLTVLILLLFVLLITRNVRYLFLITVSLTINLAIAVIFYYLLGLEIQLYSALSERSARADNQQNVGEYRCGSEIRRIFSQSCD